MIIDLTNLTEPEISFDFTAQPDLEEEWTRLSEPVRVQGKLRKNIAQVEVEGEIKGCVDFDCSRCLSEIRILMKIPFHAVFITGEYASRSKEAELTTADLDVAVFEGDRLDLTELVREQILLNLPEQSFCKKDCRGLCEKCGANRNLIDCNCQENETDPRWAALKNLK